MAFRTLDQADVKGKRALVRVDLNVPMEKRTRGPTPTRIERVVPTIKELAEKGAKVILSRISAGRRVAMRRIR